MSAADPQHGGSVLAGRQGEVPTTLAAAATVSAGRAAAKGKATELNWKGSAVFGKLPKSLPGRRGEAD